MKFCYGLKTFCFSLVLLFLHSAPVSAQPYDRDGIEIEPLFFGQGIITDNTSVRSCTIPAGGVQTCDSEITLTVPGSYGVFRLSDFDPSVSVWASVDDTSTTLTNGAAQTFDVKNFTFNPDISDIGLAMTPNADGTLVLEIGATLQTQAGISYDASVYHGTFTLQINY
jgi:hypothetical protein